MSSRCPDCGAVLAEGTTCQEIFESFLVLEYADPEYGEVHFFTVACYMIQHHRYSDVALVWIERQIRHYLEENANYRQEIRELNLETDSTHRTWKVTRQPGEPVLPKITWSMTIVDVASGYKDASSLRELVRHWARLTLDEMKPLLRGT